MDPTGEQRLYFKYAETINNCKEVTFPTTAWMQGGDEGRKNTKESLCFPLQLSQDSHKQNNTCPGASTQSGTVVYKPAESAARIQVTSVAWT